MNGNDRSDHYHPAAKIFHWLVAVLVFVVWPLGFLMHMVKSGLHNDFFFWHASVGFTVLWLMLARLCVRFLTATPAKPAGMPGWQVGAAYLNQWLLYLALICQPVVGFLMVSAHEGAFVWFGVLSIPSPLGHAPQAAQTLAGVHECLAWVILALVGLHTLAALYHRVILRDDTLARMT